MFECFVNVLPVCVFVCLLLVGGEGCLCTFVLDYDVVYLDDYGYC